MKINMKKLLLSITLFSTLFFSCHNLLNENIREDEKSYIKISLNSSARAITPSEISWNDVKQISLYADDEEIKSWVADNSATAKQKLQNNPEILINQGTYDFKIALYNTTVTSTSLYDSYTIAEGFLYNKEIVSGENELNFATQKKTDGYGNFEICLTWNYNEIVSNAKVRLEDLQGNFVTGAYSDVVPESDFIPCEINKEVYYATYKDEVIPAGSYLITIILYQDEECTKDIYTYQELIKIESGRKTTKTQALSNLNTRYTITYELNGGVWASDFVPVTERTYAESVSLQSNSNVIKDYYKFAGWYTSPDFSSSRVTGIARGTKENVTLYADWTPKTFDIYYFYKNTDRENAIYNSSMEYEYTIEDEVILKPGTLDGYEFVEWYDNIELEGEPVEKIEKGSHGNKIFFAKLNPIVYEINYNLNEGQNSSENPVSYTIESNITLQPAEKENYNFEGWYTTEDFTDDPVTTIVPGNTDDITLYAKYSPANYTITYNGDTDSSNPTEYNVESAEIALNDPTKTGYTFAGWYDNESYSGEKITKIAAGSSGNKVLYAKWECIEYTITYYENSQIKGTKTYTIEDTVTLLTLDQTGYNFEGWCMNQYLSGTAIKTLTAGSTGDINLYAKFSIITYSITYHLDGGSNNYYNRSSYNINSYPELKAPSKSQYCFLGWYDNEEFTGNKIESLEGKLGDLDLYAKWGTKINSISVSIAEESDIEIAEPVKEGNVITFTVPEGYTKYLWKLDNVVQSSTTNSFSVDTTSLEDGVYVVVVRAVKNGITYSAKAYFTVSAANN